jgi:hypothetical protein
MPQEIVPSTRTRAKKLRYWGLAAIAVVLVGTGAVVTIHPRVFTCKEDAEISLGKREAVARSGLAFVWAVLGQAPDGGYAMMTDEAKRTVSREQLLQIRQSLLPMGPFDNLRITKTYLVTSMGGPSNSLMPCAFSPNGVVVAVKPNAEQAHLVLESDTRNNRWSFVLWLIHDTDWEVESFHADVAGIVGKSASDILAMARSEEAANRHFNALILYATARDLSGHGPNFRLQLSQDIATEMNRVKLPKELQGQAPFAWHFGETDFRVLRVGPIGVAGDIYLSITHEVPGWRDGQEPERANGRLLAGFKEAFPEYRSAFAGLVAEARESGGNRLYRSVQKDGVGLN